MPQLSPEEQHSLTTGLKNGSADSYRYFYDQHFIPLYYFARGFVNDDQAAEDIAAEAFVRLWNRHAEFDSPDKVRNFLYLVARNLSLDHLRSEKRRLARDKSYSDMVTEPSQEILLKEELTGSLFQSIYEQAEQLPPQLREVFALAYYKGFSNDEISEKMNLSGQTVRNYKAAAIKTLRTALAGKDLPLLLLFLCLGQGMPD